MSGEHVYLEHLDALRTVALGGVLLFHFDVEFFLGGYTGVDCFLVLSGFLMTRNIWRDLSNGTFGFRSFYERRFWRLYPACLVTILFALLGAYLFYAEDLAQTVAESSLAAMFFSSNVYFLLHMGYFDVAAIYKPLLHIWSLSLEEQFYLVWPFVLWVLARFFLKRGSRDVERESGETAIKVDNAHLNTAESVEDSVQVPLMSLENGYDMLPEKPSEMLGENVLNNSEEESAKVQVETVERVHEVRSRDVERESGETAIKVDNAHLNTAESVEDSLQVSLMSLENGYDMLPEKPSEMLGENVLNNSEEESAKVQVETVERVHEAKTAEPAPAPVLAVVAVTAMALISYSGAAILDIKHPNFSFFMLPSRIYQFGVGGLAALLWPYRPRTGIFAEGLTLFGVAAIAISYCTLKPGAPVSFALPVVLGTAAIIVTPETETTKYVMGNSIVRLIGRASYACYLTHWVLWIYGRYAVSIARPGAKPNLAVMLVLTLTTALCLRKWVENPMRHPSDQRRRIKLFVFLAIAMGLAISGLATKGWQYRVKERGYKQDRIEQRSICRNAPINHESDDNYEYALACIVGREDAKEISDVDAIIVGDSFARHLTPTFDRIGRERDLAFLFNFQGGCPACTYPHADPNILGDCDTTRYFMWRMLAELPANTTVLVAGDWQGLGCPVNVMARIQALNLTTILVGSPPGLTNAEHFAACYSFTDLAKWLPMGNFCPTQDNPRERTLNFTMQSDHKNFKEKYRVVTPYDELCNVTSYESDVIEGIQCTGVEFDGGGITTRKRTLLYHTDGAHLSFDGADWLAPIYWAALEKAWPEIAQISEQRLGGSVAG